MSTFIQKIEAALLTTATKYAPDGSEPRAVIHKWAHAIAGINDLVDRDDATPFCRNRLIAMSGYLPVEA